MTSHKLKLKRTPEEEALHQARKERRKEKRRRREQGHPSSSKRSHPGRHDESPSRKWASSDEEHFPRPSTSHSLDYDALKVEMEERHFREKMFDALGEDERLDDLEARLNGFAHIPRHWNSSSTTGSGKAKTKAHVYDNDDYLKMDPNDMDDEEYVEWIRMGMYRKTHAEEYAEQQRKKAEHATRKAEEKARKIESKRLEQLAEEEKKRQEVERKWRRLGQAREEYDRRWIALLDSVRGDQTELTFGDIPWPVVAAYRQRRLDDKNPNLQVDDLTADAISTFLERKKEFKEAMRRYHPDKFEGRFMNRVKKEDREMVLEGIGQVCRVLNFLMNIN